MRHSVPMYGQGKHTAIPVSLAMEGWCHSASCRLLTYKGRRELATGFVNADGGRIIKRAAKNPRTGGDGPSWFTHFKVGRGRCLNLPPHTPMPPTVTEATPNARFPIHLSGRETEREGIKTGERQERENRFGRAYNGSGSESRHGNRYDRFRSIEYGTYIYVSESGNGEMMPSRLLISKSLHWHAVRLALRRIMRGGERRQRTGAERCNLAHFTNVNTRDCPRPL